MMGLNKVQFPKKVSSSYCIIWLCCVFLFFAPVQTRVMMPVGTKVRVIQGMSSLFGCLVMVGFIFVSFSLLTEFISSCLVLSIFLFPTQTASEVVVDNSSPKTKSRTISPSASPSPQASSRVLATGPKKSKCFHLRLFTFVCIYLRLCCVSLFWANILKPVVHWSCCWCCLLRLPRNSSCRIRCFLSSKGKERW